MDSPLSSWRRLAAAAFFCGLAAVALLARGAPALAHSILVESTPAPRGSLLVGETMLKLRFNNRIDPARSRLTLTGPDRQARVLALEPVPDDRLAARVELVAGAHVLRWQVLSIDGHIVRGDLPFTVRAR